MARRPKAAAGKTVATLTHDDAKRKNIPTAEYEAVVEDHDKLPIRVAIERRNRDLDPQLVWRGKDEQDATALVVQAPPLYIQEKVHPKALIDELLRESRERAANAGEIMPNLFADFNGLPQGVDKTEFYKHDQNWSNRMILGDSLQVMASLAEREGLRGKVQCIYLDPPYGIKFNSNFQWSTTSRDLRDGSISQITREPEQVKAFRDTWRDGIHSYLTYLRDRLTIAHDLLADSGSVFVQIGDENVHRVRAVIDEIFGDDNFVALITFKKSSSATDRFIASTSDYLIWFAKKIDSMKFRAVKQTRALDGSGADAYRLHEFAPGRWRTLSTSEIEEAVEQPDKFRILRLQILTSQRQGRDTSAAGAMSFPFSFQGDSFSPTVGRGWTTTRQGMERLARADRIGKSGRSINYKRYLADAPTFPIYNIWNDTQSGSAMDKVYVVQTNTKVVERCILMTSDPGDLILDPTCGAGTTALVAEQWGRRWITIDTSRVALALARARVMGARFPFYLLVDSPEGKSKEAQVTGRVAVDAQSGGDLRKGFVYERVPHVTLKSIVDNAEIDVIWEKWQKECVQLLADLNKVLGVSWNAWQVPVDAAADWPADAKVLIGDWWTTQIARQREIDGCIAAKAERELLYDKPFEDASRVRVTGPFTVESLSPHRILAVGDDDVLIDRQASPNRNGVAGRSFQEVILEDLRIAGVQQAHKSDKIEFTSLLPWPGELICAEGRYLEGTESGPERRAAIFLGPEFGTVTRTDLVEAAREASDAGFDVIIACAFNYEAHTTEFNKLGKLTVLKARMNADLHMSEELKNTGKGNLFVVFGEPDISLIAEPTGMVRIKINGVDVFHPNTGEVRSDGPDGIACWFIDTDYNEESFFVRHAYFLGANDPYGALKTTLKAEIDEDGWESLHSDTSRAFPKPKSGRVAVKVINHLGDEVMKIFKVG